MINIIVKVVTGKENSEYITIPKIHPYTLDGREIDIMVDGKPLEILECGLTNPKILEENGCTGKYGLALGLGLERILMVRKNIKDIRLLRSTNEKVLCQMNDLELYNEVSSMPPVVIDISVVVDKNLDIELLGDMVKESGVDTHIIEEVKILSETPYEDLPEKAKERLAYYQKLCRIKTSSDALAEGSFQILYAKDKTLAFGRFTDKEMLVTISSMDAHESKVYLPLAEYGFAGKEAKELLGKEVEWTMTSEGMEVSVPAKGCCLLSIQ